MKKVILSVLAASALALPSAAQSPTFAKGVDVYTHTIEGRQQVSLSEIYSIISQRFGAGRAINTTALSGNRYLTRWQTNNGRLIDVEVDANTGRILSP